LCKNKNKSKIKIIKGASGKRAKAAAGRNQPPTASLPALWQQTGTNSQKVLFTDFFGTNSQLYSF
jgi:hypothetical protein